MSDRALVLVTTSFPIASDGSEAAGSFVVDLAEELARHVPVRVVAPGPSTRREEWSPGVMVFRYAAPEKPLSTLKPWRPADLVQIVRVMRAGAQSTKDAVDAGNVGHILALWALPSGEWARRVSLSRAIPYSVWTLGSDIWTLGRVPLLRTLLRRVLRNAHVCFSDGLKLARDTRTIGKRDVQFLPSTRQISGDGSRLSMRAKRHFLFLGRWHPNKGIDLLLDALSSFDDADWNRIGRVEIQGGGPMDRQVRDRVLALQQQGRPIEVGGFLRKAEAEAAILRADWVLIPSRIESIPVVFSDAIKLGRPVVSMPVGDLPDLLAKYRVGIASESVTSSAFADAMRRSFTETTVPDEHAMDQLAALFSFEKSIVPKILSLMGADETENT